jgi:enoyl-CoA hydratase
MSDAPSVVSRIEGRAGRLTLNRPEALHSLNTAMCVEMIEALTDWREDPAVSWIIIDHAAGTRGFCAGGDIRMLADSGRGDGADARRFFHTEYRLNHLLQSYPKPVIAIMDGVTMGGGVGISVHGGYRVATERTVFAMPETGIGLFPDVGGGWFLPRLPEPELGTWLALTGARMKGQDLLSAGVATHFALSAELSRLLPQLCAEGPAALARQPTDTAPIVPYPGALKPLFGFDALEEIIVALASAQPHDGRNWAHEQLEVLKTKSPQTMKVALRQLREGAKAARFADVMRMEYRIACRVVHRHDFLEGVRAVIIDKDNAPKWSPDTVEGVTPDILDAIFAPLPAEEEWTPLPGL